MDWLWDFDRAGYRALHYDLHRTWLDPWMILISATGLGHVQLALLVVAGIPKASRPYAIAGLVAGALAGVVRLGIMTTTARMRPSNFDFSRPLESVYGNSSFPSGHTTTSFAIAFMIGFLVRGTDRAWIGWALFFWACLVAVSRIYVGVHYPTDVIGGAMLGLMCAAAVFLTMQLKGWGPRRQEDADAA